MSSARSASPRARFQALVTSGLFALIVFSAAPPVHAQAQSLPPVVITGTREPTPLDRVVGDVVVIDAEQIRASSADSVEDLLRRVGGIQLSRNGGPGQSAAILLRGSAASGTLVLIDGVRIGSASLGQTDLAALSLAQIERIEILRGPGSSLYGADAVGGVVQIITRRGAGAAHVTAHAAVGDLASSAADASIDGAAGRFDYAAAVAREASRGVSAVKPGDSLGAFNPDRDGYSRRSANLRGGYTFAPGQRVGIDVIESRLQSQYDSTEPPDFTDASPDFRNRLTNRIASLDYRGTLSRTWTTSVQLSDQAEALQSGGIAQSRYDTRRQQLTWQTAWQPTAGHQLVAALERLDESVIATGFAHAFDRDNTAAVLGYSGRIGRVRLQADAREDHNSAYGDVGTGKLGVAVDVGAGFTLRTVAGTAFRAPSFNDLYFPGYGVATIGPEHSRSIEAGLQWHDDATSLELTLYRNRVRDLIAYESDRSFCPLDPTFDFGCARNIGRATLQGATLTAAHRQGAFDFRAAIDFLDAKDDATGERLPRRAAHQESLAIDWSHGAWTTGAALLQVGARPDGGVNLPAYLTVDLQTRYRLTRHWQFEAKLLNAFDRRYEPVRDYQAVGRQGWVGLRYDTVGL